ncbi:hypothetical protein ILUMI_15255, partial [Ignelater luminosus]
MEQPKNKSDVWRLLGLLKFFSQYIPNLSKLTSNLRNLTRNEVQFEWTEAHSNELEKLKHIL